MNDTTFESFRRDCLEKAHAIYVRVKRDVWETVALCELAPEEQERWIVQWWEGRKPHVPPKDSQMKGGVA